MGSKVGMATDQVSKGYRRYVFTLLFLLYFFDYVDRLVVTSLFPFIKADWGISDAQCGMLVSAVYWSIVVFTFPVSILVDRWSRKKTIALMGIMWSLATALCVICQNLLGASLGPVVIGALSDRFGIARALTILPLALVLAALLFFAGAGFYRRDLVKVEKVALEIEA